MAVILNTEPQGTLLNAYNNSIFEFSTDIGTASRAVISIGGFIFETTPNNGLFYFNAKKIVNVLINQNAFSDTVEVVLPNTYLFPDDTLYKEIQMDFTIIKSNGTTESLIKTYNYIKSVRQIYERPFTEDSSIKFLIPSSDAKKEVTYFEGFPFDISIFSDIARTVTVQNKNTLVSLMLNLTKGVNRLFLSNGENDNAGFENVLPLFLGVNELEITFDLTKKVSVFVSKEPVECGVYLKWFNTRGAWSYWRCNGIYQSNINPKTTGEVNNDFDNIENTVSPTIVTGKTTKPELKLRTLYLKEYERLIVVELFSSPKVFLYTNKELQPFAISDWKEVKVKSGNKEILNTKKSLHEFDISIELANQYNQVYEG